MLYSGRFREEVWCHPTRIEGDGVRAKVNAKIWRAPHPHPHTHIICVVILEKNIEKQYFTKEMQDLIWKKKKLLKQNNLL
jgi:hypothetical protein